MHLTTIIKNDILDRPVNELDFNKDSIINTLNPHSYCVAKKDQLFSKALLSSDILLPDGIGIVIASKILLGKKIKRIAGADIHDYILNQANINGDKVFYLGASQNTLDLIEAKIAKEYPNISVASYSPPYKPEFSKADNEAMISAVNAFKPKFLFIGMTAPKQEKWVYENSAKLDANIITSIGAVFDFYSGNVNRSHPFWIKLGLEWFIRFLKEPKRLWRRFFISTPLFLWDMLKLKLR